MTLQDFNQDLVPVITIVLQLLGLASLLMVWWQIRQTAIWNKLRSQHAFRDSPTFAHQRRSVDAAAALGLDLRSRPDPLTEEEVELLWNNQEAYWSIFDYLNDLETVCTAVRVGCIDLQIAYSEHSSPVKRAVHLYRNWIAKVRREYSDEELYCELDRVAAIWEKQDEKIRNEKEHIKTKQADEEQSKTGVQRKV